MPSVESIVVVEAPLETVYALSRDVERFPEFMEDVEEVTILERTPERQVSRWVGNVKELRRVIRWTEEDFWNDQEHTCVFRQTEGDFTAYGGTWAFAPEGTGTKVTMTLDYEYVVPLIGALIQSILKKKMQANIDAMLGAIKRKAEGG
jgi:ribosome-associated toxin RatA of RatAB toxin-antitoxin module